MICRTSSCWSLSLERGTFAMWWWRPRRTVWWRHVAAFSLSSVRCMSSVLWVGILHTSTWEMACCVSAARLPPPLMTSPSAIGSNELMHYRTLPNWDSLLRSVAISWPLCLANMDLTSAAPHPHLLSRLQAVRAVPRIMCSQSRSQDPAHLQLLCLAHLRKTRGRRVSLSALLPLWSGYLVVPLPHHPSTPMTPLPPRAPLCCVCIYIMAIISFLCFRHTEWSAV